MVSFPKAIVGCTTLAGLTLAATAVYNYVKPKAKISYPKGSALDRIIIKIADLRVDLQEAGVEERAAIFNQIALLEQEKEAKIEQLLSVKSTENGMGKSQLMAFTEDFGKNLKQTLAKLELQVKNFQAQGLQIAEEELESHIESQIATVASECHARHKCTEESAKAAFEKYKENKEVAEAVAEVKATYDKGMARINSAEGDALPSGAVLPPAQLLDAMRDISDATVGTLHDVQQLLGPADKAAVIALWQTKVQEVLHEVYRKHHLTEQLFELSIQRAIQTDPTFERQVQVIMAEQSLRLKAAGLGV